MKKHTNTSASKRPTHSPGSDTTSASQSLANTHRNARRIGESFSKNQCLLPCLKMIGWSRFDKAQPQQLSAHQHQNTWEICYFVAGHVDWWAGDQIYEVAKGQVFITQPNEMHGGRDAIMHPCEIYWLQITMPQKYAKTSSKPLPPFTELAHEYHKNRPRLFPGSDHLSSLFERLLTEHRTRSPHAKLAVQATLNILLVDILRLALLHQQQQHRQKTQRTTRIDNIVRWIDSHLDDPLAIDELATLANLGISQFRARFGQEVGQSPNAYITSQRVIKAKHQLASKPHWPITRIAHGLGFATSQYFATVFKNNVGMTPGEYRNHYANK